MAVLIIGILCVSAFSIFTPHVKAVEPPVISLVSAITATRLQTINIYGSGFGNTWPQTVSLGDGSVDTLSSATPYMCVSDDGKYQRTGDPSDGGDNWAAGIISPSCYAMVGIVLLSWSDNEIVLGGFGTALGVGQGTWYIANGDPITVTVWTSSGQAVYCTTVVGGGLVGYWRFDEGSGTYATDSSGNGNTGTLINGPVWVDGKSGKALSFDGTDDYVQVPQSSSLDVASQVTVEAWVYPRAYVDSNGDNSHIVSRCAINGGAIYVLQTYSPTSTKAGYAVNQLPYHHASSADLPLNMWTHLAMTYDGTNVKLYVNGQFDSSYAQSGPIETTSNWLAIGCKPTASFGGPGTYAYFNGMIDEVKIYNRALSQQEIQTDMGEPAPPPVTYSVFFEGSGVGNPAQVWSATLDGYGTEYSNGPGNTIHTIIFTGVANGGPYQFIVTPPSGFVAQPTSGTITVNGGDAHQPTTFNPVPVTYTFTLTAGSGGSVSYSFSLGSGAVSSGQSQQLTVPQSCQISMTANPDSLHVFQTWSTAGPVSVSDPSSASTTATVNGNGGVTANFAYNLRVSISPTSASIQSGESATFTATPSGGSGGYTYMWYWMEYGTANHGSKDSGSSTAYIFTPSETGNYGVYVVVTDSSGNTAQSLSSPITVYADFQLNVTPQSQTVPLGGKASFRIEIIPIDGLDVNSEIQLGISSPPMYTLYDYSSNPIKPSQVSYLRVTYFGNQAADVLFTITASTTVTLGSTSKNLVHTQTVTVHAKKLAGIENVVKLDDVNVIPDPVAELWTGLWTKTNPLIPGVVPTDESFTIQQNFRVYVPTQSDSVFTYWVQNVIFVEGFTIYGWCAVGVSNIFNFTGAGSKELLDRSYQILICNPFTGQQLSVPGTCTLTSYVSGDQVILSNDFFSHSWSIPAGNGRLQQDSYISIDSGFGTGSPELVIVGVPPSIQWDSTTFAIPAVFYSTSGSVQSYVQLASQSWTSALDESPVGLGQAQTAEDSLGLNWLISSPNTASFSASSSSNYQGIFYVPVATSAIQNGGTFEDQTFLTEVSVSISGSSATDGTSVSITTASLTGAPAGVIQVGMTPAAYYDVKVQGISDGTATVSITNSGVLGQTTMQYLNGAQWVEATAVVVSGNTIFGNIPVSALTGTIIAIGPLYSPPPPPLSAAISPLSASILLGQSVTFTSTVSGGYTPYSYQWYLNGAPVSGATSTSWIFEPSASGIYYVYAKVTDTSSSTTQSETARIIASAVPVGGYSVLMQVPTRTEPILPYIALIATLTAVFTKLKPKTKRKR